MDKIGIKTSNYGASIKQPSATDIQAFNGKLSRKFYIQAFVVGILIGGSMEFLMCKTGFYRGMRKSEARRIVAEIDNQPEV